MLTRLAFVAVLAVGLLVVPASASGALLVDDSRGSRPGPSSALDVPADSLPGKAQASGASPEVQSPEDALAKDLALTARAQGWTIEQAAANFRAAEVVGSIAEQVADKRPDIFIGSRLAEDPYRAPEIYIKGPADDFVKNLVSNAPIEVRIVDNQPLSFDEIEERKLTVHQELEVLGFKNILTASNLNGQVSATVLRQVGLPDQPADIAGLLPEALRPLVTIEVKDPTGDGLESAYGGMEMRINDNFICTSGWSVWKLSTGSSGGTAAAHCPG